MQKQPEHYIDNKLFLERIKEHKLKTKEYLAQGKESPRLTNYLGECLNLIAYKLANHPWYSKWTFRDEMISDALENMVLYFDKFDSDKYDNPFAYYTQIAKWAFHRRMAKEMRMTYTKYKFFEQTMINPGLTDYYTDDDNNLAAVPMYDNISAYIADFEEKEVQRKIKIKKAKDLSSNNLSKLSKTKRQDATTETK